MRIDPNGTIGGRPALAVRKMLRYLRGWDQWKVADLEVVAALAPGTGDALVKALRTEGLIEASGKSGWAVTQAGRTFSAASVVTSKPAIEGHFKTGQRPRPGPEVVVPRRWSAGQEVFDGERGGSHPHGGVAFSDRTLARPWSRPTGGRYGLPRPSVFCFPSKTVLCFVFGFVRLDLI